MIAAHGVLLKNLVQEMITMCSTPVLLNEKNN